MNKCNRYPNCDCFNDWEKPAKEIDPGNAELFVTVMQEIKNYLENVDWVRYQPLIQIINEKLELLTLKLHPLFIKKIISFIEFHYTWKTPQKTDLLKVRTALIARFSANNDLGYYTDKKNIPNNELVNETIAYFTTGEGTRAFKPLQFLNLLWQQYTFICEHIDNPERLFYSLESIPLTEEQRHILYGFIIKWFGGYPLQSPSGVPGSEDYYKFKKVLLQLFLSYPEDTPEKEFCKANFSKRKEMQKLSIAFTAAYNHDLDVKEVYEAMKDHEEKKNTYITFNELFAEASRNDAFGKFRNEQAYLVEQSKYNYLFDVWLQRNKDWEYGNKKQYKTFLSIELFAEFLRDYKAENQKQNFYHETSDEAFQTFQRNYQSLRESFRVKRKATKEDCKLFPRLNEGDVIEYDPDYKTSSEAFALLSNYYAVVYLELEKYLFFKKYKVWNETTIKAERQEIERFINDASKESLSEASNAFAKLGMDRPEFIYLRFKSGFYEHLEIKFYPLISSIGNEEARIYGRYFLFYDFLIQKTQEYLPFQQDESHTDLQQFIEIVNKESDFWNLKKYIRENYLNIHPNNLTPERLKQIKRNISTWKLQLKDLNTGPEMQEFICETIADIDLKIDRYSQRQSIETKKLEFSETLKKEPAAPVVRRFCELINDSKLMERGIDESAETFCERVCTKYGLRYRERVSKYFTFNNTPKSNDANLRKVIEQILPNIPEVNKRQIEAYINNNTKLYG